jgi:sugar-phosphatase
VKTSAMTVIKAVIFDLDGVIINSNPAIESFWKSWTDKESLELTPTMVREWIHGRKVYDTIDGIFGHLTPERKQAIIDDAYHFDGHMQPGSITGVVEFIETLQIANIPTGVVTSSHHPRMLKMLEDIGIQDHFTHFVTAHDVQFGKPHPEPYQKMQEKMQLQTGDCLVFEDAISGIQSATAAGMHSIGIGDEHARETLMREGACEVVCDFSLIRIAADQLHANGKRCFQINR